MAGGSQGKTASLRLVKRFTFPIFRLDIWPFLLIVYPLLLWLTFKTWDLWHPTRHQVLAEVEVCWIFDFARDVPTGVPLLHPYSSLPVVLIEPLLQSSNFALLLFAGWGLGIILNIVALLLPHWSAGFRSWAFFANVDSLEMSSHIVVSAPGKKTEFCELVVGHRYANRRINDERRKIVETKAISYLKKKFHVVYAEDANKDSSLAKRLQKYRSVGKASNRPVALLPLQYDMELNMSFYKARLEGPGIKSHAEVDEATTIFGKNNQEIPIPSFLELFGEHARAPLFVFQVFCMVLWLVDEYWQYSLMSLGILILFEGQMVHRRRKDLGIIKGMHMPPIAVAVKRHGKWWVISSVDLVPGDVFSHAMSNDLKQLSAYPNGSLVPFSRFSGEEQSISCPCDAVILRGTAVVNEAMLTGESLPQMKTGLDLLDTGEDVCLDLYGKHKNSAIFAGTSILMEDSGEDVDRIGGAICYCLRTGFQTTQGKLIRTVLFSSERATVASMEANWFLIILMGVAILASGYVLNRSWGLPNRNHFKLLLHCIMIITAVVPPELPVTMSLTVTLALAGLFKKKLYCTEPFRIPTAGKLSVCCFDKTGTLTASEVVLEKVIGLPADDQANFLHMPHQYLDRSANFLLDFAHGIPTLPVPTKLVMALCNSLVAIAKRRQLPLAMRAGLKKEQPEIQILGDPLEKVALEATGWSPVLEDTMTIVGPDNSRAVILKRFPFASENQRMTVVAKLVQLNGSATSKTFVVCKGAAERLAELIDHVPAWYFEVVRDLALQGKRVLAMAAKDWNYDSVDIKRVKRAEFEDGLKFCGLLVYGCPIKKKTNETLNVLRDSGHALVMITGDDPRTAAHISLETGLVSGHKEVWFLDSVQDNRSITVKSRDGKRENTFVIPNSGLSCPWLTDNALCLTGIDLAKLPEPLVPWLVLRTEIFARVTPKDKEFILQNLTKQGATTLMCGDGTNDVGALKAAHVGIALLNFDIDKIKQNKKDQLRVIAQNKETEEPLVDSRKRRLALGLSAKQIAHLEKLESNLALQTKGMAFLGDNFRVKMSAMMRKNIATAEENFAQANLARVAGHQQPSGAAQPLADLHSQLEDDLPMLKPGDASMAAPFTYRGQNIKCVKLLVRSGKGTLATVMMMYKLMALNSLTTAFSLSVLTLNGVKFGDSQTTCESLFISILFMAASNAKSSKTISKDRVIDSLFDTYFYSSIILQTIVHIGTCSTAWWMASLYGPASSEMDGPFKPNLVNTVVWLMTAAQHAASFTANYEGSPFLISMKENKVLGRGLAIFVSILFFIAFEMLPPLNSLLKLVPFPNDAFRYGMIALIGLDLSLSTWIGKQCTSWGRNRRTSSLIR